MKRVREKILVIISVCIISIFMCSCGKDASMADFSGIVGDGYDFRKSNIGDDISEVKVKEKDGAISELNSSNSRGLIEPGRNILRIKQLKVAGYDATVTYEFKDSKFVYGLIDMDTDDKQKLYNDLKAYFENKYSKTFLEGDLDGNGLGGYIDLDNTIILIFDSNYSVSVVVADIDYYFDEIVRQ